jgi:hypothetical protein
VVVTDAASQLAVDGSPAEAHAESNALPENVTFPVGSCDSDSKALCPGVIRPRGVPIEIRPETGALDVEARRRPRLRVVRLGVAEEGLVVVASSWT